MFKPARGMWLGIALLTLSCACPEKKVEGPPAAEQPAPAPVAETPPADPATTVPATPPAGPGTPTPPVAQTPPTPTPAPPPVEAPLPSKAGEACSDKGCGGGFTCVSYYGIAGPKGPEFKSCEIPCPKATDKCPTGTKCAMIADGPGKVCR